MAISWPHNRVQESKYEYDGVEDGNEEEEEEEDEVTSSSDEEGEPDVP